MNKKILITGCTHGLGLSLSKILSKENDIISVSKKKLKHVKKNIVVNLSNHTILKSKISSFIRTYNKKLDVIILNAFVFGEVKEFSKLNLNLLIRAVDINFIANLILVKLLIKSRVITKKTKIILISSRMSEYFIKDRYTYSLSKNVMENFIKYLVFEGYNCSIIRPGAFQSNLRKSFNNLNNNEKLSLKKPSKVASEIANFVFHNSFKNNYIFDINGKKLKKILPRK